MSELEHNASSMRLRSRVVWIPLIGIVPLVLLIQWSDMVVGGTMMAGPFPPLGACLCWGALWGVNSGVRRVAHREWLTRAELLLVLAAWIAANMVAGRGLLHPLLASLAGPTYYARSGVMARAVPQYLPDWLAVTDKRAARDFFEGHGLSVPWQSWWHPLQTWALFFAPFLTANICLCALFERVWIRHERLAFPLVALPLALLHKGEENGEGTSRAGIDRRAIAFGLALPLLLHGFGVANAYYPAIPCVPFFNDLSGLLTSAPWTALRPLYFNVYPLLIGLTFLAPADVTLSVWFFVLLNKVEMVWTTSVGWNDGATGGSGVSSMPYLEEQSAGAYLALGALLVWNARRHLRQILMVMGWQGRESSSVRYSVFGVQSFRRAVSFRLRRWTPGRPVLDEQGNEKSERALSSELSSEYSEYKEYRLLAWGFVMGVIGILAWCVWTGLPLWFATLFFGFYFTVALVLSRLMAEGGVSWILAPILPDKLIFTLLGSAVVSPLVLTRLTLHVQHLRDTRQMLMPAGFEAGKLRDATGAPSRRFYGLLLASVFLALMVGIASALPTFYHYGALSLTPNSDGLMMSANVVPLTGINQASERLRQATHPSSGSLTALVLGTCVTWLLALLRTRLLWWPLHPLGYALTGTLQQGYANKMLFSIFAGWACKTLTLRLGGAHGFRLLRGAALGLILGDLLMGALLKLLDALLGPSGYAIF